MKIDGQLHAICLDTGCTMSLIDRSFLNNELPDVKVQCMTSPIAVRGLGSTSHNTAESVLVDLYLLDTNGQTAHLQRELHIVEELRAKVLLGIDINSSRENHD